MYTEKERRGPGEGEGSAEEALTRRGEWEVGVGVEGELRQKERRREGKGVLFMNIREWEGSERVAAAVVVMVRRWVDTVPVPILIFGLADVLVAHHTIYTKKKKEFLVQKRVGRERVRQGIVFFCVFLFWVILGCYLSINHRGYLYSRVYIVLLTKPFVLPY